MPPCSGTGWHRQSNEDEFGRKEFRMARAAFIGLGVMGYPMAGHIARGGHEVTVYNRTPEKAKRWVEQHGGKSAPTPADAAKDQDFVFACVGNDDDLRSVTTGPDGAFAQMKPGSVFIDNTTASAAVARELADAAKQGEFGFLDAPVSSGQAGAENGVLTVMVGGEEAIFDKARPVIECYARMVGLMGPAGSGQLTKMVNQICIAGLVQGLAEGIHFAQNAGLDVAGVIDVISKGAAGSWQMENRWKTMNAGEYEHGFAVDWMRKDLDIVLAEARRNASRLPATALVDQFYAEVQAMGGHRWDTSSLLARLKAS
ncbi:MAG: NAD(P)-dependent oxidoreductase [Pseudomonadota bacterium]|nr:NAD(P)-dependent oxidoreductase [Pseudomonadota bacterium]